jgi:hypothetical protein
MMSNSGCFGGLNYPVTDELASVGKLPLCTNSHIIGLPIPAQLPSGNTAARDTTAMSCEGGQPHSPMRSDESRRQSSGEFGAEHGPTAQRLVARGSSCNPCQCSASTPFMTRARSAAIQLRGLPVPENPHNELLVGEHQSTFVVQRRRADPRSNQKAPYCLLLSRES